jgi:Fe-S cluster biogenesis protein NfuA/nitrite reductase/ring-hydroxylating ferredoxin subunit
VTSSRGQDLEYRAAPGEELLDRFQALTEALEELPDGHAREVAEDLIGTMVELYGEGLVRILDAIDGAGEAAAEIRARLVGDGVVASLLLIHDLYPVDLETRVEEALASVRPYLESHGGNVELLGVADGVARISLVGHCKTCPASAATLELAIKQAIDEAAPDLLGLEVEGIAAPPARPRAPNLGRTLPIVTVGANGGGGAAAAAPSTPTWLPLEQAGDVELGTVRAISARGARLVVANVGGSLLAYRDQCPGCLAGLAEASLQGDVLTCSECGRGYDLPRAGQAVDGAGAPLEPVPLLRRGARAVEVAVAT